MKTVLIKDILKEKGLKNTPQRLSVLTILKDKKQPISAEEIYFELKQNNNCPDLSTVYRCLEKMTKNKIVSKLNINGMNKILFEFNEDKHKHYLICKNCNKITTIYNCPLKNYEKNLEKQTNFKIDGHQLFLYGYCLDCSKKH